MKCHDVQRMISGFIEEKLTDEQLEGFLEHIENARTVMMNWKSTI